MMLALAGAAAQAQPTFTFMAHTLQLKSYNQTSKPSWEFVPPNETVDNWTTMLTAIERADAHTQKDVDGMAEGIMSVYKSNKAQILMAKTMQAANGQPYNYMVAAFEEPARHRFELNFVKMALGGKNGYTLVYSVRIGDPNYLAKSKAFLSQHSGEIGDALAKTNPPDFGTLPRKVF